MPRALAVLRLMTSSNLVGCSIGRWPDGPLHLNGLHLGASHGRVPFVSSPCAALSCGSIKDDKPSGASRNPSRSCEPGPFPRRRLPWATARDDCSREWLAPENRLIARCTDLMLTHALPLRNQPILRSSERTGCRVSRKRLSRFP